jgi:hypothetical protein
VAKSPLVSERVMTGVPGEAVERLPQPASRALNPNTRAVRARTQQRLRRVRTTVIIYPLRSVLARAFSAPSLRGAD